MVVETIWQKRFESLQQRIAALQLSIDSRSFDRKETLQSLTACLMEFAQSQFNYFYHGFKDDALEPLVEYPPDHVLTVTLEQISYDLEAIQWAVEQRCSNDTVMQWALEAGDKLTWAAISPARESFQLNDVAVVVYFQKFAEIRVIPYAPVALIGLPITCIPVVTENGYQLVARDFLAIPHEVGHYVYWHGRTNQGQPLKEYIDDQIAPKLPWGNEWLEELFADVYGCLIAGPLITKSFQDLQMRVSQDRFFSDDGEHPAPFLRPDIYAKVLKKRGDEAWAAKVNTRWQTMREKRAPGNPYDHKIRYARTQEQKQFADYISFVDSGDNNQLKASLDRPLDIAINELLQLLGNLSPDAWWQNSFGQASQTDDLDDLYELFEGWLRGNINQLTMTTPSHGGKSAETLQNRWKEQGKAMLKETTYKQALRAGKSQTQAQEQADEAADQEPTHPQVWLKVLQAVGWATKGPESNPVGS